MLFSVVTVTAFAAEEDVPSVIVFDEDNPQPDVPYPSGIWDKNVYPYAFAYANFVSSDKYDIVLIFSKTQPYLKYHSASIPYYVYLDSVGSGITYQRYKLSDDATTWEFVSESENAMNIRGDRLLFSSSVLEGDGYTYNVNYDFFIIPLPEKILMTAEGQMEGELPKMTEAVVLLTVCGVGLMALLIGLPLFGKVLRRFLG